MNDKDDQTPRLTPRRTFIVQLQAGCSAQAGEVRGRVEHLTSGASEPFVSLAALLEFISRFESQSA
jgi:hypothetical protein